MKTNKENNIEVLKSIETGATEPIGYINLEKYIQHNLGLKMDLRILESYYIRGEKFESCFSTNED